MGDQQQKTQGQDKTKGQGQMDKGQGQWDKDKQYGGQQGGQMDTSRQQPGGQTGQTPQVGTHGSDPKAGTGGYSDTSQQQRDMTQGDYTKPAQPGGTTPLERDQQPVRKER